MKLDLSKQIQKNAYKSAIENSQNELVNILAMVGIDVASFDTNDTSYINELIEQQDENASYANGHLYKRVLHLCTIINNAEQKLLELE